MKVIQHDAQGMAELLDAEAEELLLECGILSKFGKVIETQSGSQNVIYWDHPTHFILARRFFGQIDPAENGFQALCYS